MAVTEDHFETVTLLGGRKRHEAAREDDVAGVECDAMGAQCVGEPCDRLCGVALHRMAIAFGERGAILRDGDMQVRQVELVRIKALLETPALIFIEG